MSRRKREQKPNPANFDSRDEFLEVCIPQVLSEGTAEDNDQAVAICSSMWEERSKEEPEMRRMAALEIKQLNAVSGKFAGWASVFDIEDDGGDTVRRGAFASSLKKRKPKIYLEHTTSVGVFEVAEEREKGLWVEGQPDESPDGLTARAKLKSGALDALSIGFRTITAKETGQFKRDLLEVDLFHVGLVPFGMLDEAVVTSVKSLNGVTELRELEQILRDAGLSKQFAQALCSPGYIASLKRGEPDDDVAQLVASITAGTNALRR
jgi:HK97 family phage prohead protease